MLIVQIVFSLLTETNIVTAIVTHKLLSKLLNQNLFKKNYIT